MSGRVSSIILTVQQQHGQGLIPCPTECDLDLLNPGDVFYIEVLGKTLTYEVHDIQTVLPYNIDPIQIQGNEGLCTLITYTNNTSIANCQTKCNRN